MKSEALKNAQHKYNKKLKRYFLNLRKDKEEDVKLIEFIESKGKINEYLKALVKKDLYK